MTGLEAYGLSEHRPLWLKLYGYDFINKARVSLSMRLVSNLNHLVNYFSIAESHHNIHKMEHFTYIPSPEVIVCMICQIAIFSNNIRLHLRRFPHKLSLKADDV